MNKRFAFSLFAIVLACLTGTMPASAADALASDGQQIEQVVHRYGDALNAGDAAAVASLYTADAVVMVPNIPTAVGRAAVLDSYAATFKAIALDIRFKLGGLDLVAPEWAVVRSTSQGSIRLLARGAQIPESNQELFVMHKVGGEWKIARYSFSSMLAAPQYE